jgi:hypothetical protein
MNESIKNLNQFNDKLKMILDLMRIIEEKELIRNDRDAENISSIMHNIIPQAAMISEQQDLLQKFNDKLEKDLDVVIPILKSIVKP